MSAAENAVDILENEFGDGIERLPPFRGDISLVVDRELIVLVCERLCDDPLLSFDLLAALTAVDHWPDEPRFTVVYQLYSISNDAFIRLKVRLSSDDLKVPTVETIYPGANWHEREVFDMFGVSFERHSDLRRIIMPHDWEGHPLRKDYPLGHEEVQFSFNYDEIDRRKRYAED
ncbi:MAG: NADH-quinone oxidoreductase subunit C [Anaerolineales bacterium]|nr:NADH-quinone oxidoreductase subunit C [Anaerolineales bacterium]